MQRYFYALVALCVSTAIGAASSSLQQPEGRICFTELSRPLHVYESAINRHGVVYHNFSSNFYNPRNQIGCGLRLCDSIISENALQNPRMKKGFPVPFTQRYRYSDGTWDCADRCVLPQTFIYRDIDENQIGPLQNPAELDLIHDAPCKRFPAVEDESLFSQLLPHLEVSSIPQNVSMYLEKNRFDGTLLHTVSDYFRCFPNLGYLSLRHYIPKTYDKSLNTVEPAIVFSRVQEHYGSSEPLNLRGTEYREHCAQYTGEVAWDTLPALPLGDTIPAWQGQCMRTKNSLSVFECLKPWINPSIGRVIDLRNHTIDSAEIQRAQGEGNIFILHTYIPYHTEGPPIWIQISRNRMDEINRHFAQQPSWPRRCLDTLYAGRYYLALGASLATLMAYISNNHSTLAACRATEIDGITKQICEKTNIRTMLQTLIQSADNPETVAGMSAEHMRAVLQARLNIKDIRSQITELKDALPKHWDHIDSLFTAIQNKIGTITNIGLATYAADFCAKYFLGYRPYIPSRIHPQDNHHDYFADKVTTSGSTEYRNTVYHNNSTTTAYCCESCCIHTYNREPRDFDAIIPHHDAVTEHKFKRNQNIALVAAWTAGIYGLHKLLAK